MARIELAPDERAPELHDDFDRIVEHLAQYDLDHAAARSREIVQAFDDLEMNPQIGRRSRGDVALYQYAAEIDTVFALALRSQREAGYWRG
jgi:plasmid stabilization system protein ParE